ncbi:Protein of unknown function [Rosenbergiella nectarea]|uniref:Tlde1 domain-containing protein n=2 Tax=Rosenbergiella TaxID=1356488 RepID=A0A1H9IE42_9GAMM|nr:MULTISPECIES: DUF2778 domain-containing protein [Rosenbergiella]MBT0723631.1 DUF2778 domain-containing protein [Rosenbergiella gaditana]SEQ72665.1 Protein of unknown function [Rosenbergiella nectarea]
MAITCFFTNNGMPTSLLTCSGVGRFPAFSGQRQGRNNASLTSVPDIGPIPQGTYYIIGRQSGGRLSSIREAALKYAYGTDRSQWFSLYRRDGKIDDYTFIEGVRRGNFRLHPIGPRGLSEGCITLSHITDFDYLRNRLLKTSMINVPGSLLMAYGTIRVD